MLELLFTKTPLLYLVQPLWRDEAFSYLLAKRSIIEILTLTAQDFNPPLYYFLLHYWVKIFGDSEVVLRILSLIFFCAVIYVADHVLIDILHVTSRIKRTMYLLLIVLNPMLHYYAFEARMYSMFAFLSLLSFYSFYTKKRTLFILSTFYGLFTHYFMVFVIVSQFVFLCITGKKADIMKYIKTLKWSLVAFALWISYVFLIGNLSSSFWISLSEWGNLVFIPAVLYTGYERGNIYYQENIIAFRTMVRVITLLFTVIAALYFYQKNKKELIADNKLLKFIAIWSFFTPIIIFLISFFKPLFLPRYLIYVTPGIIFLLIFVVERTKTQLRYFILTLLFMITLVFQYRYVQFRQKLHPAQKLLEIKQQLKTGEVVYVTNELDFFVAQYYLGEGNVFLYGKEYTEIPAYVGKVLIPENKLTDALPLYPDKAIILDDNGVIHRQSLM